MNKIFDLVLNRALRGTELGGFSSMHTRLGILDTRLNELLNAGWILDDVQQDKLTAIKKQSETLRRRVNAYCKSDPDCLDVIINFLEPKSALPSTETVQWKSWFGKKELAELKATRRRLDRVKPENRRKLEEQAFADINAQLRKINEDLRTIFHDTLAEMFVEKAVAEGGVAGVETPTMAERRRLRSMIRKHIDESGNATLHGSVADELLALRKASTEAHEEDADQACLPLAEIETAILDDIIPISELTHDDPRFQAAFERNIARSGKKGGPNFFDETKEIVDGSGHEKWAREIIATKLLMCCVNDTTTAQEKFWEYGQVREQMQSEHRDGNAR
ncbi:MAG: hypothetical protein ACN2B6_05710 [Rickettsiales bacterium]